MSQSLGSERMYEEVLSWTSLVSFVAESGVRLWAAAFWGEEAHPDVLACSVSQTQTTHSNMAPLKHSSRPFGLVAWGARRQLPITKHLQHQVS